MFALTTLSQLRDFLNEALRDDVLTGNEPIFIKINKPVLQGRSYPIIGHTALYGVDLTLEIGGEE